MEITQLINEEMLTGFFRDVLTVGFLPGFILVTILHLLGYGIFKTLSVLNIRK